MITNIFILKHSTVIEHFGTLHMPHPLQNLSLMTHKSYIKTPPVTFFRPIVKK